MPFTIERKLHGSRDVYVLSIPMLWLRNHGADAGSNIAIEEKDNALIIKPFKYAKQTDTMKKLCRMHGARIIDLPAKWCKKHNIKKGDKVRMHIENDYIIIEPLNHTDK